MIETSRSKRRKRKALVITVFAILAACQTLPEFRREPRETAITGNAYGVGEPEPVSSATAGSDAVVTLDRPAVRHLQTRLAELGFEPGPIDGIVGSRTTEAIERYQRTHQLPTTGRISPRFLKHLETTLASRGANSHAPITLAPEDFPAYQPGMTFIYSNGEVDRVADAEGTAVRWIRTDGTNYTTHRNFLLPWSNWASDTQRGTATISEAADALWPLRKGVEIAFSTNVTVQRRDDPNSIERHVDQWRCRNDGRREITVLAGTFQTLIFVCRLGADPTYPEVVRTWYYAQEIRHYVRFTESHPKGDTDRTVDLVSVRPGAPDWPPIVRAALARAVVHTLEMPENESQMLWTSSVVDTRVTIEGKSRFVALSGRPCRRFTQIWSENSRRRLYPSVACKTAAGRWQIPGLKSDKMEMLIISDAMP